MVKALSGLLFGVTTLLAVPKSTLPFEKLFLFAKRFIVNTTHTHTASSTNLEFDPLGCFSDISVRGSCFGGGSHRVHLSQHRALAKEQWLAGVHQD